MAGATNPLISPYPKGTGSTIAVRIGGYIPASRGAGTVIDTFILPWDCYVRGVDRSIAVMSTNGPDDLTLKTVDATALTIVADLGNPVQTDGVAQTLHANIVNVKLVKGNKIQMTADTAASEAAMIWDTVHLEPAY